MLARHTDFMRQDDSAVDQILLQTFDQIVRPTARRRGISTKTSGGQSKVAALSDLARNQGYFQQPTAHPALMELLQTLADSLHFFSEARAISASYPEETKALEQLRTSYADLLKGDLQSSENEAARRSILLDLGGAEKRFKKAQRVFGNLEIAKDTPPFRYQTFIDALQEARNNLSITSTKPQTGCKKVVDRVEAARKTRKGPMPRASQTSGQSSKGKGKRLVSQLDDYDSYDGSVDSRRMKAKPSSSAHDSIREHPDE